MTTKANATCFSESGNALSTEGPVADYNTRDGKQSLFQHFVVKSSYGFYITVRFINVFTKARGKDRILRKLNVVHKFMPYFPTQIQVLFSSPHAVRQRDM
jgi:hypothetical protein